MWIESFIGSISDRRILTLLLAMAASLITWLYGSQYGIESTKAKILLIAGFMFAWLVVVGVDWYLKRRADDSVEDLFQTQAKDAVINAEPENRSEIEELRTRMGEAVATIKSSKLGKVSGRAALYELPWYMIIGNPAAGKSSAIINSGLNFPLNEQRSKIIQGIGGTRNCDWFFSSEGILIDTAGRYTSYEQDNAEWLGFLKLLLKHRPRVPINGIIVAASVEEMRGGNLEQISTTASNLRKRIQEIIDNLGVFVPVYVLFSKLDLVAGFNGFFENLDNNDRKQVWGVTLPYQNEQPKDVAQIFQDHFEVLKKSLDGMALHYLELQRGQAKANDLISFPSEFASLEPTLNHFIKTLFADNPYQFKPVFRGFYFTSALQAGEIKSQLTGAMIDRFNLTHQTNVVHQTSTSGEASFFLTDLFNQVILRDRQLVRQYNTPARAKIRQLGFAGGLAAMALLLGLWTWSYSNNHGFIDNISKDMKQVQTLQNQKTDLVSRMEAMLAIQNRIEQLQSYRESKPLQLSMGLYQGDKIEGELRREYFKGLKNNLLDPVHDRLENILKASVSGAARPDAVSAAPLAASTNSNVSALAEPISTQVAVAAAPRLVALNAAGAAPTPSLGGSTQSGGRNNSSEAYYNALKTYLMLGTPEKREPSFLSNQLAQYWQPWLDANRGDASKEKLLRLAEQILNFSVSQMQKPDSPTLAINVGLTDASRGKLKEVYRGIPAIERVYAEIKARANSRFPAITVNSLLDGQDREILAGSYALSGTFSREAWENYVKDAVTDASKNELQATDWVLGVTSSLDNATIQGSPEQISKELQRIYKDEYAHEWLKFIQGIVVQDFVDVDQARARLARLGDPFNSPLSKILLQVYRHTSWDNPSLAGQGLDSAKSGVVEWFKSTILRQVPSGIDIPRPTQTNIAKGQLGYLGNQFAPIAALVVERGGEGKDGVTLLKTYHDNLIKIRSKLNSIGTTGDVGAGSKQLIAQTLDGSQGELVESLKYVEDTMLNGLAGDAKNALRPMLLRPLMQVFAVLLQPTAKYANAQWQQQVVQTWSSGPGQKYPFNPNSTVEATQQEISQFLGPEGAVAKYIDKTMTGLVNRNGDIVTAKTWADMGLILDPSFSRSAARLLSAGGTATASAPSAGAGEVKTLFQMQGNPIAGVTESILTIDGQVMRYRNTNPEWVTFNWPVLTPAPGAKLEVVTEGGQSVTIFDYPGNFGLSRMMNSAKRTPLAANTFSLTWESGTVSASYNFRIISGGGSSDNGANANASGGTGLRNLQIPPQVVSGVQLAGNTQASIAAVAAPVAAQPGAALGSPQIPRTK